MYKISVAKKLLKEAYNAYCLRLGNHNGGIYIAGGWWIMFFPDGIVPKEIKGEIVSLCGLFPEPETAFVAGKEREPQMEIIGEELIPLEAFEGGMEDFDPTNALYQMITTGKVYVGKETGRTVLLDRRISALISPDEDESIYGPVSQKDSHRFYWISRKNEDVFAACDIEPDPDSESGRFIATLNGRWP